VILVSPWVVGPDVVREIAGGSGMAVISHPSLTGAYFQPDHGIAPELLLGDLFRILGSDAVIYPNHGGRFPFSEASCRALNARLRGRLGKMRRSFPMPGGGVETERIPHWIDRYGPDTIFLVGGSFYSRPDPGRAAADLLRAIEEAAA
jgi:ribulose-bisphosphate carboxylase large chain